MIRPLFCSLLIVSFMSVLSGQAREGELDPYSQTDLTFDCRKGKDCMFKADFGPKYQKERTKEECEKFKLMGFVNGQWFGTVSGFLKYVEEGNKEVLKCEASIGYGSGHAQARSDRRFTVRLMNDNIWKGVYRLEQSSR